MKNLYERSAQTADRNVLGEYNLTTSSLHGVLDFSNRTNKGGCGVTIPSDSKILNASFVSGEISSSLLEGRGITSGS